VDDKSLAIFFFMGRSSLLFDGGTITHEKEKNNPFWMNSQFRV
jgi:hypothetical protein